MMIVVPGEPRPMQRARRGPAGNFYTPRDTVEYESAVAWEARKTREKFGKRDVIVYTDFHFTSVRKKADGDNCHKAVLDALEKAEVYENDNQVVEGHYRVFRGSNRPYTVVRVYSVDKV